MVLKNNIENKLTEKIYFRYQIIIEYLGLNYHGSQLQPDYPTIYLAITQSIKKSFSSIFINFAMAARTDKGVHAMAHSCHLDLAKKIDEYKIMMAINYYLKINKEDISVIKVKLKDNNFHARYSAKYKIYQYKIINRKSHVALYKNYFLHIPYDLDINNMIDASKYLIGKYDFTSFKGRDCTSNNNIKDVKMIDIILTSDNIIKIYIKADAFLQYMVRNIIGTLLLFGKKQNKLYNDPKYMKFILESKDRNNAGERVKAQGLYLQEIIY